MINNLHSAEKEREDEVASMESEAKHEDETDAAVAVVVSDDIPVDLEETTTSDSTITNIIKSDYVSFEDDLARKTPAACRNADFTTKSEQAEADEEERSDGVIAYEGVPASKQLSERTQKAALDQIHNLETIKGFDLLELPKKEKRSGSPTRSSTVFIEVMDSTDRNTVGMNTSADDRFKQLSNVPGAFRVFPRGPPSTRDNNNDHSSDSETGDLITTPPELESSIVNDEDRHRALREAWELGRRDGLQQLSNNVVLAVPVETSITMNNTGEANNNRQAVFSKRTLIIMGLLLVAIVASVVVSVVVILNRTNSPSSTLVSYKPSSNNSLGNESSVLCFPNAIILQAAVDSYLQPSVNSTYNNTYGPVYGTFISDWCVSKIQSFDDLFNASRTPRAQVFDADLSRWNMSNATSMAGMFSGAGFFRGIGLDQWNVSQVTNMAYLFEGAYSLDVNFSSWDVSKVTSMHGMFKRASIFRGIGLDQWNTTSVTDTSFMFDGDALFDANLTTWDVSKVFTMREMFSKASNFTGAGLEFWNTTNAVDMEGIFRGAAIFDANLSNWDVSKVTDMSNMFSDAKRFQGVGLEKWDIHRVTNMDMMFQQSWLFNNNLSTWNTSQVQTMRYTFFNASIFQGVGLAKWNVSRVWSFDSMFWVALLFDANLGTWDVSRAYNFNSMFCNAYSFGGIGIDQWQMSNATDIGTMFFRAYRMDANLSSWDVSRVIYMFDVFGYTKRFQGIGLEKWDVGNVQDISNMFMGTEQFDADLSLWNVSNIVFSYGAFVEAAKFRGAGLNNWDVSNVIHASRMFAHTPLLDVNLSNWQVSKIVNMTQMFYNASSFHGHGLDQWNVSSAKELIGMFEKASAFNISLCNWAGALRLDANTSRMFTGTDCPIASSPNMNQTIPGPFCYPCGTHK